ncbi:MAG TPA: PKD domain-containing protein [bacterium]
MRLLRTHLTFFLFATTLILVGCTGGFDNNPVSPNVAQTEWRAFTVNEAGGTFNFPEIGIWVEIPSGAVPTGEVYSFSVRGFPDGIPPLPGGPVYVRMATMEMDGPDVSFLKNIKITMQLAEPKTPGAGAVAFQINGAFQWQQMHNNAVYLNGNTASMYVDTPGIYGAFLPIPLNVEISLTRQSGPVPLSVGLEALVTGGHPPYLVIWNYGDNDQPESGLATAHVYDAPGVYSISCFVTDESNHQVTDLISVEAYGIFGPTGFP